jgi:hypothetical protein
MMFFLPCSTTAQKWVDDYVVLLYGDLFWIVASFTASLGWEGCLLRVHMRISILTQIAFFTLSHTLMTDS